MHSEGENKLRSHNTSHCLIEVVPKAGLTVYKNVTFAHLSEYTTWSTTIHIYIDVMK
jgi:hypothetical protein